MPHVNLVPRLTHHSARRRLRLGLLPGLLAAVLIGGCVVAPYPYGEPVPAGPSTFDRSWDAALSAAADAGIQVTAADRSSGRISGTKAGAAVGISVQSLADGRVQVAFDAPTSRETNPTLADRWTAAYNRRMGR
jgi:ABC-type microcin C transport system permease subunit YejB